MDFDSWSPQEDVMIAVKCILQDALIPDSEIQRKVQDRLKQMQNHPDFAYYLLYIIKTPSFSEEMRSLSGILLKNYLPVIYSLLSQNTVIKLRQECLLLLRDPCRDVRASISNVIYLIAKYNLSSWPDLIPFLVGSFETLDEFSEAALNCLFNICEELMNSDKSENDICCITKHVFPKFVEYLSNDKCNQKPQIIKLINQYLQDYHSVMKQSIDLAKYLTKVIQLANIDDVNMQKQVCQTFVIYVEYREESLLPHLHDVIIYLILKTQHEDLEVAQAACEFWLATTKLTNCKEILMPYISTVLPILLKNMKYSQFEIIAMKDAFCDEIQNDSKDIYPFHLHDKKISRSSDCNFSSDDDENDDITNDGTDDYYVGWTLRKCSAASLDAIAVQFGDEVLNLLVPLINEILTKDDFLTTESAILAIGAISEGCMNGLKPHLPQLLTFLLQSMDNPHSIIRVITCWTLSRYSNWIIHVDSTQNHFIPVMTVLLKHFLDSNKRVQGAAISAFCVFQEEAQTKLIPHIDLILEAFCLGFQKFHYRNLYLLYDAVGVLAQSVGEKLNKREYTDKILPPIMKKLHEYDDYADDQFIAVLECLACLVPVLGLGFLPYSEMVYSRCLEIISETLMAATNYQAQFNECDPPDKEAMHVALDVLYSMAIGLKSHFNKFVINSSLICLLFTTIQDCSILIRQTSIALYGELLMLCYPYLRGNINDYIPLIIKNLDGNYEGVCNNAAWVVGKLCSAMGNDIRPYLAEIITALTNILKITVVNRAMYQTVAVSLCLICYICPDVAINDSENVIKNCCMSVRNLQDSQEKDMACRGLCVIVTKKPEVTRSNFIYFCESVASWNVIYDDLKNIIRNVFSFFKQQFGEQNWFQFYIQLPEVLKLKLSDLYGI